MAWTAGDTARADGTPRATRRDSEADRIVIATHLATQRLRRGVTVGEIGVGYTSHYGDEPPAAFTSRVHSLVKGGVLVAVGGRVGRTRYAWRETAELYREADAVADPGDDVLRVLVACTAAVARRGRAVSTREVAEELRRLDLVLGSEDINAVRRALTTLARTRTRGHPDWHAPRVVRETYRSTTGHGSAWWRPAARPAAKDNSREICTAAEDNRGASLPAFSRSAAIRAAVDRCVAEVGRPVSRRELRWWLLAGRATDLAAATLAKDLESVAQADRRAVEGGAPPGGRLLRLEGDLTAFGAAPPRVVVMPSTWTGQLAGRIEDAALGLRLADEVEGIARARRHAERRVSAPLARLATARESALRQAFAHLTVDPRNDDLAGALTALAASYDVLEELVLTASHSSDTRDAILREFRERRRHVGAVSLVAGPEGAGTGETAAWRLPGVSRESLTAFVEAAGLELGQPVAWAKLLTGVRRTVSATPEKAPIPGRGHGPPAILIDRVDALQAIYRRVPVARANALLGAAEGLLGQVLRNPALVRQVSDEAEATGDRATCRAAVISLGLLGALGREARALAAGGEARDVAAAILATVLADPAAALDRVAEIGRDARNAEASRIAEKAAVRIRRGRLISVIG